MVEFEGSGAPAGRLARHALCLCEPRPAALGRHDGQRERRYRADDVARLKRRRDVGRKAESIAANALDFGTPVLESSLTLIENGRLYYRGHDATRLARNALARAGGAAPVGLRRAAVRRRQPAADDRPRCAAPGSPRATLSPVDRCLVLLPAAGALDHPSWVEDRAAMLETGVRMLRLLTAAVTARAALGPARPRAARGGLARAGRARAAHPRRPGPVGRPRVQRLGFRRPRRRLDRRQSLRRHDGGPRRAQRPAPRRADPPGRGAVRRVEGAPTSTPSSASACAAASTFRASATLYPDGDIRAATLFAMLRETVPDSPELAFAERWPSPSSA